ncbi:hypothetical protein [Pseudooceanicola sp.]|uniref:hypothetical protein n=1 Tax=Pseudooceanicola sp. TaxID=1914328 RepID=UPI003519CFE5
MPVTRSRLVWPATALGLALCAAPAQADRQIASFEGISIATAEDFTCGERIHLRLTAPDPASFGDSAKLARLAGTLQAFLGFECPEAKDVMLKGFDGEQLVYQGVVSARSNWAVMTMLAPPAPEPPSAPEPPTAMPNLADRKTDSAGKSGFLPQLPEATAQRTEPAPSAAPEPRRPAAQRAAADALPEVALSTAGFDPGIFARPRQMQALYRGDFDYLDSDDGFLVFYLLKMNEHFSNPVNFYSNSCAAFANPDLGPQVTREIMRNMFDPGGGASKQALEILAQGFKDLATNPGALFDNVSAREAAQNAGEKDGVRLSQMKDGCDNPIVKAIYQNLQNYLLGDGPAHAMGWPGLRMRCAAQAARSGGSYRAATAKCRCIEGQLKSAGLNEENAEWLARDYGFNHLQNFELVFAKHPASRKSVGLCLLTR